MVVSDDVSARAVGRAKKQSYHHGDLARALVTAALDLIGKRGPEGFTLREVAAAVGVTHGAAYRHFEDKDALLAAVAEEGYRALTQQIARAMSPGVADSRQRLRALAAAYVEFVMDNPARYRVMWGPRLNESGRFPSLEAAIADSFAILVAELERGQAAGAFRDEPARDLGIAVWVTAHGYVGLVLGRRIKVKSNAVAVAYFDQLLTPLLDGLAKHPRATPKL